MRNKKEKGKKEKKDKKKTELKGKIFYKKPVNENENYKILSCTDEDLKEEKITPEHCRELRKRKFSNDPKDLFIEVRSLEERYKFEIDKIKKKWELIIQETKENCQKKHDKAINEKKKN